MSGNLARSKGSGAGVSGVASGVIVPHKSEKFPKAYEEGYCNFYGREFKVTPDVLIPRPETETLIDGLKILAGMEILPGVYPSARMLSSWPAVLDVGTGSGVLGITAKLEVPEAQVIAIDISEKVLAVARENGDRLCRELDPLGRGELEQWMTIDFLQSDLLESYVVEEDEPEVILANLPYVDPNWEWLDKEALSFEPEIALYAEEGGLSVIFRLLRQVKERGFKPFIILEADPSQHKKIVKFARELGYLPVASRGFCVIIK